MAVITLCEASKQTDVHKLPVFRTHELALFHKAFIQEYAGLSKWNNWHYVRM